jgi:hypothetical protein
LPDLRAEGPEEKKIVDSSINILRKKERKEKQTQMKRPAKSHHNTKIDIPR